MSNSTLLMKRQRIDANWRLAIASGGSGQAGLLLREGLGRVENWEDVAWRSQLLLEKLLLGVFNGDAKGIEVINSVAISWATKANAKYTVLFVNTGSDRAVLRVACH